VSKHKYGVRYKVEDWNKPRPAGGKQVQAGITVSDDDHGYADAVFVASIVRKPNGETESVLLLDSDSGGLPTREMLLLIREAIDHQLECHT
jgi:hypothetical protein